MSPTYLTESRYLYLTTPLGPDLLLLSGFSGSEEISEMFQFELELMADNRQTIAFDALLGQHISFGINVLPNNSGAQRHFDGICIRVSQGGRNQEFTRYRMTVAPRLWLLTQRFTSRTFQNISVPDILKAVLAGLDVSVEIQGTFEKRDYCVQYQESDFQFVSRLMEEEGIFYFFKFEEGAHTMVLGNMPSVHPDIDGASTIIYEEVQGGQRTEERIAAWEKRQDLRSGKYTLWDYCFEMPHKHLEAENTVIETVAAGKVTHKLKVGGNEDLEIYEYPGLYAQRFDGVDKSGGSQASELQKIFTDNKRTAGIRIQQTEQPMLAMDGASNCRQISAGHKFSLQRHFNADGEYVTVAVTHHAEEGDFRSGSDALASSHYGNEFRCIPVALPFRPVRKTPRPFIRGCQTAIVVGPAGEEIFTDQYGRVKIQFPWDREGKYDGDSSCWARVGTSWAGKNWGAISIPRVGQEVIVAFLEGDPDQPIITGSVYNAETMPPYALPDHKTYSGVKTRSSVGGGGFNELRFEDLKGSEQVFLHGEKDMDIRVKNDCREWIGQDRHLSVTRDKREKTGSDSSVHVGRDLKEAVDRDHSLKVGAKQSIEVTASRSLKVNGAVADEFGSDHSEKTTGDYYLHAKNIVLQADTGLTICVGGNFVTINAMGVSITGTMVNINSGGAALSGSAGSIVPPAAPADPDEAADSVAGEDVVYSGGGAQPGSSPSGQGSPGNPPPPNAPRHDPNSPDNRDKKHYIEIEMTDDENLPVAGEPYEIVLPDGSTVASGTTDEKGRARVDNIDPGQCQVRWPRRDQSFVKAK